VVAAPAPRGTGAEVEPGRGAPGGAPALGAACPEPQRPGFRRRGRPRSGRVAHRVGVFLPVFGASAAGVSCWSTRCARAAHAVGRRLACAPVGPADPGGAGGGRPRSYGEMRISTGNPVPPEEDSTRNDGPTAAADRAGAARSGRRPRGAAHPSFVPAHPAAGVGGCLVGTERTRGAARGPHPRETYGTGVPPHCRASGPESSVAGPGCCPIAPPGRRRPRGAASGPGPRNQNPGRRPGGRAPTRSRAATLSEGPSALHRPVAGTTLDPDRRLAFLLTPAASGSATTRPAPGGGELARSARSGPGWARARATT